MTITCTKVFKSDDGILIACDGYTLKFNNFKKGKKNDDESSILLTCSYKKMHNSQYKLSQLSEEDKPLMHDIVAKSKSRYAECSLSRINKCNTDDEKAKCLEKSYDNCKQGRSTWIS